MEQSIHISTPIGLIAITASEKGVKTIRFCNQITNIDPAKRPSTQLSPTLAQAVQELEDYFAGSLHQFTVAIDPTGTPFQLAVWKALSAIPYGERRSYKQIATVVGNPSACRAVGMANNRNPIPIIIPCHRVVGTNGSLVGYAGGLDTKEQLLALETMYRD